MLGAQVVGLLSICGWVAINMVPFFAALKVFGVFRVDAFVEEMGMDMWEHGGGTYVQWPPSWPFHPQTNFFFCTPSICFDVRRLLLHSDNPLLPRLLT